MKTTSAISGVVTVFAVAMLMAGQTPQARATLLVEYTYDEASSGTTNAINAGSLGAAADGVFNGAATRTSSGPNFVSVGALNLPSNSSYVGPAGVLTQLEGLSTMTVSTWINVQGGTGHGYYSLVSDQAAANPGWLMYYSPVAGDATNMKLGFQVNGTVRDATANVSANNTWVFVAATWNRVTGDVNFYSGTPSSAVTQVGSTLTTMTTVMANSGVPMRVGQDALNLSTPIAFMDDTRVYDNVLSLSQLEAVRLADLVPVPEPGTGLLGLLAATALLVPVARRKFGFGRSVSVENRRSR